MNVDVFNMEGKKVDAVELPAEIFEAPVNVDLMHQAYIRQMANARLGTHSTKTRSEVRGGGRKPWRQKGTGRARQGSTRATQMRHGATAHGPQAAEYTTRVNKKERRLALCMVLSEALRDGKLSVVNKLELPEVKTKAMADVLNAFGTESGLFVLADANREVELSGRNIPNTKVVLDGQVSIYDLLKSKRVIVTEAAIDKLEERLA